MPGFAQRSGQVGKLEMRVGIDQPGHDGHFAQVDKFGVVGSTAHRHDAARQRS